MSAGGVPAISVEEAAAGDPTEDFRLDVREMTEWLAGHAPDSEHIPLMDLPASIHLLPPMRRIVCICRSGNRSGQATEFLRRQGFDAVNMAGGMQAWMHAGLPVVRMDGRPGAVV